MHRGAFARDNGGRISLRDRGEAVSKLRDMMPVVSSHVPIRLTLYRRRRSSQGDGACTVIRLTAFITDPGPIRKILTHRDEPLEPFPHFPAAAPDRLGRTRADVRRRAISQASLDELPEIDIHSL